MDFDLSTGALTLYTTPVPGLVGPPGPAGMGSAVPGGRLTLISGSPEMLQTADYSSTTLYYAPYKSDQIPLFDGANWGSYSFTSSPLDQIGLTMAGGAKWAANTSRDVFATRIGGAATLCTGPAWTDGTMALRGLIRRNGLWVNSADMLCDTSAATSATVPANGALWVGSINIGPAAGTLTATFTLGQNRRCDVWNLYHQLEILLGVGCPPAGPTAPVVWLPDNQYSVGYKAFNNDLNNSGYYFTGLPQSVACDYSQWAFINGMTAGPCAAIITICKDSLTSPTTWGQLSSDAAGGTAGYMQSAISLSTSFKDRSSVGSHKAIMAAAGANNFGGVTLIGMDPRSTWGRLERGHIMWIKYQG